MGTRGAFGVIIGEKEKIGYNQYDSYPSGKGLENLRFVASELWSTYSREKWVKLAKDCRLVSDKRKPTKVDKDRLRAFTDLSVSEQSLDDWYCLTRQTHGSIEWMLRCGYILDSHDFPLDSVFCEWGYMIDFDKETFEVYRGFQSEPHLAGRFAGRLTEDDLQEQRDRYHRPPYYEIALIASYPFEDLPSPSEFLKLGQEEEVTT